MKWEKAILRPSAMNIKCSVVCLHPWSENTGNIKPSGRYLSPENAVSALLPYLKENTEKDIVALLFCAPSAGEFYHSPGNFQAHFRCRRWDECPA